MGAGFNIPHFGRGGQKEGITEGIMKRFLVIFLVSLLSFWSGTAIAAGPYLTVDPYDTSAGSVPTHFYLVFDNGAEVNSPAVTGWGPATSGNLFTMKHDLSTLADGSHNVKARACIVAGGVTQDCSDYSSLWAFGKAKPATPAITVVKEGSPAKYYLQSQTYSTSVLGGPPDSFSLSLDGGAPSTVTPLATGDALGVYLKYEITNVPTGTHVMNVFAVNDWGNSSIAAVSFQRYVVVVPKGIKILR
jgi:hypothetical protein